MSKKALLVTGATGKQGGALIDAILSSSAHHTTFPLLLAVTRSPHSAASARLLAKSTSDPTSDSAPPCTIVLVPGNLDDPTALLSAASAAASAHGASVWGVFSVQLPDGRADTANAEVRRGKGLVDAALAAGVRHLVYSSVERGGDDKSWGDPTRVPHFRSKWEVELHLRDASAAAATAAGKAGAEKRPPMTWTVLRPVAFMDNLTPGFPMRVFLAALRNALGDDDKALQWVAVADIGVFAAKAFAEPERWAGRAVGLAGDELTMKQLGDAFERGTGSRPVPAWWWLGSALTGVVREVGLMAGWFGSDGYAADIKALREEHTGLMNMEAWLREKSTFVQREAGVGKVEGQ